VVFGLVWLVVAAVSRYSSLAALVASLATPFFLWSDGYLQEAQLFALFTVLLWVKHRSNIARLAAGTEGKIGAS
jgi:glycerol-3-phosphate acyltransferase PlsY